MPGSLLTRSGDVQIGREEPHHTPVYGAPVLFRHPDSGEAGQWVEVRWPDEGFQPLGPVSARQAFWPRGDGHGLSTGLDSILWRDIEFTIWIRGADRSDVADRVRAVWRVAGQHADTTTPTEVAFQVDTSKYWCRARCVSFELSSETVFAGLEVAAQVKLRMLHPAWFPATGTEHSLVWADEWPHWMTGYDTLENDDLGVLSLLTRWHPPFDLRRIDVPEVLAERVAAELAAPYEGATTTVSASTSGGPRVWTAMVSNTDTAVEPGLWTSGWFQNGDRASTADTSSFAIPGDIDIRWYGTFHTVDVGFQALVSKYESTGGQRSWALFVDGTDPGLALSADGVAAAVVTVTGATLSTFEPLGLRATWEQSSGTVTIYTSDDDGVSWVPYGTTVIAITGTFTSTANIEVGVSDATTGSSADWLGGVTDWVEVRSGISGTVVASPDFGAQAAGTTQFVDAQGNTWTVQGETAVIGAPHYMAWPALADIKGVGGLTDPDRMIGVREGFPSMEPPSQGSLAGGQAPGDYFWFDSLDQEIWLYDASEAVFTRVDNETRYGSQWFPLDDGDDHELVCFPQGPQLNATWLGGRMSFYVATTGSATVTTYDAQGLL